MEEHLSSCGQCRLEVASWRRLDLALRAFPIVQEPVGFKAAVMGQIAAEAHAPAWAPAILQRLLPTLLSAATGTAMVIVGLMIALLNAFDIETLLEWTRDLVAWGGLYLELAYPNLLLAGWLLTGAIAVALVALVSGEGRRTADTGA